MLATKPSATGEPSFVSVTPSRAPVTIAEPELARFLRYWEDLASADGWASRQDLDPVAIPQLLPFLMVTQVTATGGQHVRVTGTHITDHVGFDPTGEELSAYAGRHGFADVCLHLAQEINASRAPIYAGGKQTTVHGAPRLYRRLICPLRDGNAEIGATVSCVVFFATTTFTGPGTSDGAGASCEFAHPVPHRAWREGTA